MKFEDSGLVLVEGWNYDTQRANGAGKTALFNCLSFGLYDKLPRKITASEILKRGSKSGFVRCNVLCGEDVWTVQRSRPKGVEFSKNGVKQDITQEEFQSFIRLSYEQFLLTIYVPQANSVKSARFLAVPDSDKKEFVLQLLNLDAFKSCKQATDSSIKSFEATIALETGKLNTTRSRIEAYEESLIDTASVEQSVKELQFSIKMYENELLLQANVPKPDLSKYVKIEDDIRSKQAEIAQAKAKRSMLHDRYRELNSSLHEYDADAACSQCGSSTDTAEARTAHSASQAKIKAKMVDIKEQIDAADTVVSKEQSIQELSKKLRDKKSQESIDYQAAIAEAQEIKSIIREKQTLLQNNLLKLANNSELLNKINILNNSVANYTESIATCRRNLELYKAIANIYSPTGAQAYVLDSVVDSFNEVIQKYIDIMSPNMSYVLNSFKENARGDVVAKFSETLTKGGQTVSVGSLSGGEEKGLSLCVDFALLEVLETQFGMSLNPIILDEPFDGLDIAGREIVIDLLDRLAKNRQIFVIDHASEAKALFTKSILVELRNDTSTISDVT